MTTPTDRQLEWLKAVMYSYMSDKGHTRVEVDQAIVEVIGSDDLALFGQYFGRFEVLANDNIMILDPRSNMKKAIKITAENINRLRGEYLLDESELDQEFEASIGFWLIADFGAKRPDGYVNQTLFDETFDVLPTPVLKNDYVAIVEKGTYVS